MSYPKKPVPASILVFGASAHIGGPLARYVRQTAPSVKLRLATSDPSKLEQLRRDFPQAECVLAHYYDLASMQSAFKGIEGCFLVSPDFLDEDIAMSIVKNAARRAGTVKHIVRILADPPGMTLKRVPDFMHVFGGGTAVQHFTAKEALLRSDLPLTFVNAAGWYFDNYLSWLAPPILHKRTLCMAYDRPVLYLHPGELGELCGRLLLSDDERHLGQFYQADNGQDFLKFSEVAALMSEIFGMPIGFDGTDETFTREIGEPARQYWSRVGGMTGGLDPAAYFLAYWKFEYLNSHAWRRTDFLERMLGRRPTSMRDWLTANRSFFVKA